MPRFEILKSINGQYYFVLIARNGEIIATSEMYVAKQSCKKGLRSVKRNAFFAKVVDKAL